MTRDERRANMAFIVLACNSHDDLLAACKAVAAWEQMYGSCDVAWPGHLNEAVVLARAAIAKAEA